ncbi:MAG: DUF4843 domain-containing protein [Prevotella sp.]|jgi:hypothetical protein|nr:DUF4843 domain-containing protein [Prevotella sp.]
MKMTFYSIFSDKKNALACLCLALLLPLLASCSKEEVSVYDTDTTALNIWVGTASIAADSTIYNYSYSVDKGFLVFHARVAGMPVDFDRPFELEAFEGDLQLAEGSYSLRNYVIPAGAVQISDTIDFDTSKLRDASAFSVNDGRIRFRVKENNTFQTGAGELSALTIVLKNYLAKPAEWDAAVYPRMAYAGIFGVYSRVKYQFMIQILGMMDFHIDYRATVPYDEAANTVSYNYALFLADKMRQALDDYNATHATPLTDETGTVVTF